MKYIKIYLFISLLYIMACEQEKEINRPISESTIVGSWTNNLYTDSMLIYTRILVPKSDQYSLTFQQNHILTEHKNSGWCGTPPIVYADFTGEWNLHNQTLEFTSGFWGGEQYLKWEIVSVSLEQLIVKPIFDTLYFTTD